jgi:hypothetical protein
MIAREGFEVNHKKVRRIYTEEKLQVRRRGGRKRASLIGFLGQARFPVSFGALSLIRVTLLFAVWLMPS